jgi:hypothetical protein
MERDPMNPNATLSRHIARIAVICGLVAGGIAAVPTATSATSIAAAHAPGGTINVALGQHESGPTIAVSRSVGLMDAASGSETQADLGYAPVVVTRSVGLMVGAGGTAAEAQLGYTPIEVTRSVGLMDGARG